MARPTRAYIEPGMWPYTLDYRSTQVSWLDTSACCLLKCRAIAVDYLFWTGLSNWKLPDECFPRQMGCSNDRLDRPSWKPMCNDRHLQFVRQTHFLNFKILLQLRRSSTLIFR